MPPSILKGVFCLSRSYRNKDGVKVELSDEILNRASVIKKELQKASHQKRCSWPKLIKMMIAEGVDPDLLEHSENFRQCIKFHEIKQGTIEKQETRINKVQEAKLDSIKKEIGEIKEAKLNAQKDFRRLSKMQREMNDVIRWSEAIERAVSQMELPPLDKIQILSTRKKGGRSLIVCLSDIHYGSVVDVDGFKYNQEISRKLMQKYALKVISIIKDEGVEEVYVVGMGDYIEQAYMRNTQAYTVEDFVSKQIAGVTELVISFIRMLLPYAKVSYTAINGNHDRAAGNKNDSIYGDGLVNVSNEIVKTYIKYSGDDVRFIETEPYHFILDIHNRSFLFVHGDQQAIKKPSILAEQSMLFGKQFDALFAGHIHHYTCQEVGQDKYVATFGSLKPADEYALKTIGVASGQSQGVILVDDEGFDIRMVKL